MLRAVICLWALGFVSWLGMTVQFRLQRCFSPVCWPFAYDTRRTPLRFFESMCMAQAGTNGRQKVDPSQCTRDGP